MSEEKNELITKDSLVLLEKALEFWKSIESIEIKTETQNDNAATAKKELKSYLKDLEAKRVSIVKPYNEKVTAVNKRFKEVTEPLKKGDRSIDLAMGKYYQEQERIRIEKQRKIDAEIQKKREAEEARAEKEMQKAKEYEEMGRQDMAEKAEARAASHIDVADNTIAEVVEEKKVAGISMVKNYVATIKDMRTAAIACLDNPLLADAVSINLKDLERICRAAKGNLQVDGVEFKTTFSTRTRI